MKKLLLLTLIALALFTNGQVLQLSKTEIDDGLTLMEYSPGDISPYSNNTITVLKVDPDTYTLDLLCANQTDGYWRDVEQWASTGYVAAVNSGMSMTNGISCGYLRSDDYTNQRKVNSEWNCFLAANPKSPGLPKVQIVDRQCQDWWNTVTQYDDVMQCIRIIDCNQNNVWAQQDEWWSMVVAATDKQGNILFCFTRSPYTVHDFGNMLLDTDLDIYNAMYLEGGPEASLYINHNGTVIDRFGSYETGFNPTDNNEWYWPIPNAIGISKR